MDTPVMRLTAGSDLEFVRSALARLQAKSPAAQMKYTDLDTAMLHIEGNYLHRSRVVGGYFILFDIGSPWYSKERFLIEDIILRIYPTEFPVTVAIDALSTLATMNNCTAVMAGDTQIGHMVPLYQAAGFVTLGTQLIKELDYGVAT
jgi:hypothetical protein